MNPGNDDCLLRYVLQHSSEPVRILRGIYDALPVGGRVFAIEEDSALFVSTEDWPAFAAFVDGLRRVYAATGSDFDAGRKLHVLAREAGFEVEDFRIGLRSNVDLGTDLIDWLIGMTHMLHHSAPAVLTRDASSSSSATSPGGATAATPRCSAIRRS